MTHWEFCGDIDLTYGGYYWREDGYDDYVLAVSVTPCSDAGGPDNLFYVEKGSIYINPDRVTAALPVIDADPATATRRDIVEALMAYGGIDRDAMNGETVIQIGPDDKFWNGQGWQPNPDVKLRANTNLRKYIEREFLD